MPDLPPRIHDLLSERTTLVLATERDGRPWVASVFCAPDLDGPGVRLLCALLASSRKLANLRANPRVAVYLGPQEPTQWAQATGTAAVVEGPGASAALARLTAHAPGAQMFVERVPVVPVALTLNAIKLTDLTGEAPVIEMWPDAGEGR